jgi:pimeloyl-ACP methyl ester carboxylesterase
LVDPATLNSRKLAWCNGFLAGEGIADIMQVLPMTAILSILFWICVIAGLLGLLGYVFFRYFQIDPAPDSIVFTDTDDDWRLGLTRYRPSNPLGSADVTAPPVILCPGAALSCLAFDAAPELSLAGFLSDHGHDVWLLDPRGRGVSQKNRFWGRRRLNWSFDDYVEFDLPAAVSTVCQRTGAQAVQFVGFGLGGLLGLAGVATGGDRMDEQVCSLATLGSTAHFRRQQGTFSAKRIRLLRWLRLDLLVRVLAPLLGRLYPPQLQALQNRDNIDGPIYRRALVSAVGGLSRTELLQYAEWLEQDSFTAIQQRRDFREALAGLTTPTLMVAGPRDELAPPDMVEATYNLLAEVEDKALLVASRMHGMSTNYGHLDLLLGRSVRRDIQTHLLKWLDLHAGVEIPADRPQPPEPREGVELRVERPTEQPVQRQAAAPASERPEDVLLKDLDEDDTELIAGDVPRVPPG